VDNERKFDLEDHLIEFASGIIDIVESLPNTRAGNYIAGQLIRCGLAPSFMYGEAQAAESRDDFIYKMKMLLKELKETRVCLKLILRKVIMQNAVKLEALRKENEELIAIISKSIDTAKRNNQKGKKE